MSRNLCQGNNQALVYIFINEDVHFSVTYEQNCENNLSGYPLRTS